MHVLLIIVTLFLNSLTWAGTAIGTVSQLEGKAQRVNSQGKHLIKLGEDIEEGDEIQTLSDSHVQIHFNDEAYIAIRPNSRLRIDSYRVTDVDQSNSLFTLFKGSLRAVTGWVGKTNAAHYRVNTPNATLGVRGTDYETVIILPEEASEQQAAGTYNTVYEGEIVLQAEGKTLNVTPAQAVFAGLGQAPRLFANLPVFLQERPKLDERLEAIKPQLQQRIQLKIQQIQSVHF